MKEVRYIAIGAGAAQQEQVKSVYLKMCIAHKCTHCARKEKQSLSPVQQVACL